MDGLEPALPGGLLVAELYSSWQLPVGFTKTMKPIVSLMDTVLIQGHCLSRRQAAWGCTTAA